MKYLLFFCIGLFFAVTGCSTTQKQSAFTGTYKCDGYSAKGQKGAVAVEPFIQTIEHKKVNGLDFVVVKRSDTEKNSKLYTSRPSGAEIYIVDGNWRHITFTANKELKTAKKKASFSATTKNSISWKTEVPAYTTNSGKKLKAASYSGHMWIDSFTGDKKSKVDFVDKTVTCKKESSKVKPL